MGRPSKGFGPCGSAYLVAFAWGLLLFGGALFFNIQVFSKGFGCVKGGRPTHPCHPN